MDVTPNITNTTDMFDTPTWIYATVDGGFHTIFLFTVTNIITPTVVYTNGYCYSTSTPHFCTLNFAAFIYQDSCMNLETEI